MDNCFQITIIGAGSAGILTISELLCNSYTKIAWVDPEFNAGALQLYTHMPSNTKVQIQLKVAEQSTWFKQKGSPYELTQSFRGCDPDRGSVLGHSYEMFKRMIETLDRTASQYITKFKGVAVQYEEKDGIWEVSLQDGRQFKTSQVVFCVGGQNRDFRKMVPDLYTQNPQMQPIDIVDAMCPKRAPLKFDQNDVVAVVGASHSGLLALKTLNQIKNPPKRFYVFYLNDVYFAEHLSTGDIKYDFIGLKGDVAIFIKKVMEQKPEHIQFVESNKENMTKYFPECTKIVTAVGFERNNFGKIIYQGTEQTDIKYDPCMGHLTSKGEELVGLYGGGIAFPEKKVDVCGLPDCAVGFFKQMNYIQKLLSTGVLRPRL